MSESTRDPRARARWAWLASLLALTCIIADWALAIYLNVVARAGASPKPNDLDWLASNVVWGVLFPLARMARIASKRWMSYLSGHRTWMLQ